MKVEREYQEPQIISDRTTKEINPQEIAESLGGVLEKSADDDSKLDIHLYYGESKPVLTLKCNPERQSIFLGVNASWDTTNKSYRSVSILNDIEEIRFVKYVSAVSGRIETDMLISVRDKASGLYGSGMAVSSHAHEAAF